jgi:hypothetical protein
VSTTTPPTPAGAVHRYHTSAPRFAHPAIGPSVVAKAFVPVAAGDPKFTTVALEHALFAGCPHATPATPAPNAPTNIPQSRLNFAMARLPSDSIRAAKPAATPQNGIRAKTV